MANLSGDFTGPGVVFLVGFLEPPRTAPHILPLFAKE
jgi:hypothetical protein